MSASSDLDRFHELVAHLRPRLHRYCARMTGSVFDGEDVLQDTLTKAFYALATADEPPTLEPWLFRIAHDTAIAMFRDGGDRPAYFMRIEWDGDRIAHIRDYRHVPTIADGARFTPGVDAS